MGKNKDIVPRLVLSLLRPLQRLPLGFHYFWGRLVSFMTGKVFRYRRDVVMTNLARSFPEKKYGELTQLCQDFYRHLGEVFAETIWFGGNYKRPERLRRRNICTISNPGELAEAFRERPSVMVLDSHYGNWELIGGFFQYFGPDEDYPIKLSDACVVYRRPHGRLGEAFFRNNRCAPMGGDFEGYVETRNVLRYCITHSGEKKLYIFPTDQFPYRRATRHEIPSFMNQPTKAMTGAAALASKYGWAVFYLSRNRDASGHTDITFRKICDDASLMSPGAIMEEYYSLLEKDIRRAPAEYLWSHKRWKY